MTLCYCYINVCGISSLLTCTCAFIYTTIDRCFQWKPLFLPVNIYPCFFFLMVNINKNKQGYISTIKTMNVSSDTKKGFIFYGTPQMLANYICPRSPPEASQRFLSCYFQVNFTWGK